MNRVKCKLKKRKRMRLPAEVGENLAETRDEL